MNAAIRPFLKFMPDQPEEAPQLEEQLQQPQQQLPEEASQPSSRSSNSWILGSSISSN